MTIHPPLQNYNCLLTLADASPSHLHSFSTLTRSPYFASDNVSLAAHAPCYVLIYKQFIVANLPLDEDPFPCTAQNSRHIGQQYLNLMNGIIG